MKPTKLLVVKNGMCLMLHQETGKNVVTKLGNVELRRNDENIGEEVGAVFQTGKSTFELCLLAYPSENSTLSFNFNPTVLGKNFSRKIFAVLENCGRELNLQVGVVQGENGFAEASFHAIPSNEAQLVF